MNDTERGGLRATARRIASDRSNSRTLCSNSVMRAASAVMVPRSGPSQPRPGGPHPARTRHRRPANRTRVITPVALAGLLDRLEHHPVRPSRAGTASVVDAPWKWLQPFQASERARGVTDETPREGEHESAAAAESPHRVANNSSLTKQAPAQPMRTTHPQIRSQRGAGIRAGPRTRILTRSSRSCRRRATFSREPVRARLERTET